MSYEENEIAAEKRYKKALATLLSAAVLLENWRLKAAALNRHNIGQETQDVD